MSLPNWTTRVLPGAAKGAEAPAPSAAATREHAPAADAASAQASVVGSRIGAYRITKRLGAGGVGEVFKGTDTLLKREVAIKMLRDELAADPLFLERFRREAQLHAQLSHPNVASVHAFVEQDGKPFIVMEFVAGISLDEFVRAGGPVPVERALAIFRRALDGIEHAHARGIVHRDIKPANIMLADNGQVKVMDFGIAKALDTTDHLTRHGHVAGTAKAMSPEQIRGKQADVRSDVYSLGIVLYTLLAGRPPFDRGSDIELMKAQLEQAPPPLGGQIGSVPPQVEAVVMKALAKDPAARFQSVREFAQAIDACMAGVAPPSSAAVDHTQGPPTLSRTAINPVLQGAQRLPGFDDERTTLRAPKEIAAAAAATAGRTDAPPEAAGRGKRPGRVAAVTLTIAVLAGGGALLWWQLQAPDVDAAGNGPKTIAADHPAAVPATAPAQPAAPAPTGRAPVAAMTEAHAVAPPAAAPIPAAAATGGEANGAGSVARNDAPLAAPSAPAPATAQPAAAQPVPDQPSTAAVASTSLTIVGLPADGRGGAPAAGPPRFRAGERIQLLVTPSRDAYVYCYLQDETRSVQRFFPNRFHTSALARAGEPLEIPGHMRFELVANSRKVTETVACFASERDLSKALPAAAYGRDFAALRAASLDELRQAFARVAPGAVAESRFRIEVR